MSLLITNGHIVTPSDDYVADVYCENGTITAIGSELPPDRFPADHTIDASGKYVLAGGIDVHTHRVNEEMEFSRRQTVLTVRTRRHTRRQPSRVALISVKRPGQISTV
jgi:dihydroorotase-like cyclic amidohydrolase